MDKTLQTTAWNCLPREFREEVKKEWSCIDDVDRLPHDAFLRGKYQQMRDLFGIHNLTSDAEGEVELLHVTRQKVMVLYANAKKLHDLYTSATCINEAESRTIDHTDGTMSVLKTLFGSKCLPDLSEVKRTLSENLSEQKPAEPKYHRGEKVCYNGYVYEIEGIVGKNRYALKGLNFDLDEDMIEPYIKPEENIAGNRNLSQDCDKEFDNILKNSFSKERRLNIAAMAMQGMLSNTTRFSSYEISDLVRISLNCADALIKEAEKGGDE